MLVLKSRFTDTQQELSRLKAEKSALQDKIHALETALDDERRRVTS